MEGISTPDAAREARGVGAGELSLGKGTGLPAIVCETLVKKQHPPIKDVGEGDSRGSCEIPMGFPVAVAHIILPAFQMGTNPAFLSVLG